MRRIEVPLYLIDLKEDGFHLLVAIKVFGSKHFAVVDSGASRTVFDKQFIERHTSEIITTDEINATTLFSTSSIIQAKIPKIRIGKLKIADYTTVALDLESVNAAYTLIGQPSIVAILGSDLLYLYQAKLSYKKLKLIFSKSAIK